MTTAFRYDGLDVVRESSGGTDVAYLRSLTIDEALVRTDPTGSTFVLADALGSTVALTDAAGATATEYTFAPFGDTAVTGAPTASPFHFTGRENDGTGLYYYRARYYDAATGRFLSEDPLGFSGGMNFYAYVHNSPTSLVDPYGLLDSASPQRVGWEWLTGTGPRMHHFTDGDPFTELLTQHQHIQDLINNICNGTLPSQGVSDYDLSGVQGIPKYLRDYSTILTGGLTGNLAVTYLGGYGLSYSVTNGTLNIHVSNSSTISSLLHVPVIGYTALWKEYIGDPMDKRLSSGPMSQTSQFFDFHEDLRAKCGCKR